MRKLLKIAVVILSLMAGRAPAKVDDTPKRVSLKKQTPPVGDMGNAPAGQALGWAIGYYAPAITFRLKPAELLSPYYLFDMLPKEKCQLPDHYMEEAQRILKDGYLRNSDYKKIEDCTKRPDMSQYRNVPRYRVNLSPVLLSKKEGKLSPTQVLYAVRRRLDSGVPVIASMDADHAFRNLKSGVWRPVKGAKTFVHTVVIVGYDDFKKEVEVVSSWGKSWGSHGFGRVSYGDLEAFTQLSIVSRPTDFLIRNEVIKTVARAAPTKKAVGRRFPISGMLRIRTPVTYNMNGKVLYDDLDYVLENGVMRARDKKPLAVHKQFQVVIDGVVPSSYLYVFSRNSYGKTSIIRPQKESLRNIKTSPYAAIVQNNETQIVLPRAMPFEAEPRSFTKSTEGTDFLIILHSRNELKDPELQDIVNALKGEFNTDELDARLKEAIGDRLVENVTFDNKAGKLVYSVPNDHGYILPIVVRID